jgi:hypothetical protein
MILNITRLLLFLPLIGIVDRILNKTLPEKNIETGDVESKVQSKVERKREVNAI